MRNLCSALLAVAIGVSGLGGCAADKSYSQTELDALQSREFDATFDRTFDATVEALFDAGYFVQTSDKRGGVLTASRTSGGGWSAPVHGHVQIKLDSAGRRTSVRVSTSVHGQQRVDKQQIDELLNLIDRRLTGMPSAKAAKGGA